jgi:uncharacterized RDD family membrane protein YckC
LDDSIKPGNLGLLADMALSRHKNTFAQQAAFAGLINGIFAAAAFIFGWVSLAVIWPAIPNFTGNQTVTDGIILGTFSILMLLIVAFFVAWQSAATIVVCKHHGRDDTDLRATIKAVTKAAMPALTVLFALILIFVPFLAAFAFVIAFNLDAVSGTAPPTLFALFMILVVLRTLSFFAVNLAVDSKHQFLSALVNSAKIVIKQGFVRIFAATALITAINLGIFLGLFFALLTIFGQVPANLTDFLEILANPMGVAALMFLAYLITIFATPKTQILAYTLYSSADAVKEHQQPSLASRSLAAALDIVIVGTLFAICFYGAAVLVSGGGFALSQMNVFAAIIAIIAFFAVYTIYNVYFEAFGGGQTPAKYLFGLIVRGQNEQSIGIMQSLVRNVLRIVDIFGFVAIVFNKEHRRLGDLLSLATVDYKLDYNVESKAEYKEDADVSR